MMKMRKMRENEGRVDICSAPNDYIEVGSMEGVQRKSDFDLAGKQQFVARKCSRTEKFGPFHSFGTDHSLDNHARTGIIPGR
jgi:hypothetical protein